MAVSTRLAALPGSEPRPRSTLFIDFNAYFASVEQQLVPELRGLPIAVAPVTADSGCCIAASYQAKAFGVKTGMRVREARRLCPNITIVDARPHVYVDMHHKLLRAIDRVLPVHGVHSIDEMSCRLIGQEREPGAARELGIKIKRAIRGEVGEHMLCSIGVCTNRLLAKVAADMQKPDGLTIIEHHQLRERLATLQLMDFPGIGPRMHARLTAKGITSVEQMLDAGAPELADAWESVVGRRWHRLLRGEDLDDLPTRRRSVGHSHVLSPERRESAEARAVAMRLLLKAASRMRSLAYAAQRLTLSIRLETREGGPTLGWGVSRSSWHADAVFDGGSIDTLEFTDRLSELWERRPTGRVRQVGVTLSDLIAEDRATLPLFDGQTRRANLSRTLDAINNKFGRHAVYSGAAHSAKDAAKGGIAFGYIPDTRRPDALG